MQKLSHVRRGLKPRIPKEGRKAEYKPEDKKLEKILTWATTLGVAALLAPGLIIWNQYVNVPKNALEVDVMAWQGGWQYRLPGEDGKLGTNPEELILSALAGCFNMKLAFVLNEENFEPEKLETNAKLLFEDGVVKNIHLELRGLVPKIEENRFKQLAEDAKDNCPISGVLNCEIFLIASLL